jgi:hypothetical protein
MKIVVLGDCASDGTNVLAPEVTGRTDAVVEVSLTWGGKHLKEMNAWYLRKTKNKRGRIDSIVHLYNKAMDYLKEQELKNSYWKYIDYPVTNLSKGGITAGGYYKRLLKYEKEHGKPDFIFITDHALRHSWQVINHQGKKYFLEKEFDPNSHFMFNDRLQSSETVQRIAYSKAKTHYENGQTGRRNKRMMTWFLNYLDKNNYKYQKIRCYSGFTEFDTDEGVIDCSDLVSQYLTPKGDRADVKVAVAPKIAKRILNCWPVDKSQ